ncbi:MAG: glutamate-cysteine ligase family protein, partial [Deltaproteobacteria bacterium]|nr:glutamate-cysteine ligase family protein [Deltaproteobacteria bacterium]
RRYLPTRGDMALDMMTGTATVQTNIDYSDESDMSRKLRAAMSVSPFLTALFANSPFANGKPTGWLSERMHIWEHTDPDRSGFIPRVFAGDFGYDDYVHYALDVPMFFIYRQGAYQDYGGRGFRDFLHHGLDGNAATEEDWELHLTTLFPLVRLKKYLELRMTDVGPLNMICALSALTRGLFYDKTALGEVLALVSRLRPEFYPVMQLEAARIALRAEANGRPYREWCRDLLAIARAGLIRLNAVNAHGENEAKFLDPLDEIVDSGLTQAERLLAEYEGPWQRRMDRILSHAPILFCPPESAG